MQRRYAAVTDQTSTALDVAQLAEPLAQILQTELVRTCEMPEKADSVHLSGRLRDGNEGGRQEMEGKGPTSRRERSASPPRPRPQLALQSLDREEPPLTGHPAETVNAAILKAESRSRNEILHRARDQHLVGCRHRGHARPDMNGDATKFLSDHLALAGMQPGTDLNSERANSLANGGRAADGPRGAIGRGQEPIAGGVNLPSPKSFDLSLHPGVEPLEDLVPAPIAEGGRALRRTHDVDEEHGGQQVVRIGNMNALGGGGPVPVT